MAEEASSVQRRGGLDYTRVSRMRSCDGANSGRETDHGELVDLRCSALVLRENTVLLCRKPDEGVWVLPGGTPNAGEGAAAAAEREVFEETGLATSASHIAFVLETTSGDFRHHLVEIVFLGVEMDVSAPPRHRESGLMPSFVPLEGLGELRLMPPLSGYIRGLARYQRMANHGRWPYTAAYLGYLWREPEA